jgi:hypothetical protein
MPRPECEDDGLPGVDGGSNTDFGVQLEALHGKQIPLRRLLYACLLNGSLLQAVRNILCGSVLTAGPLFSGSAALTHRRPQSAMC